MAYRRFGGVGAAFLAALSLAWLPSAGAAQPAMLEVSGLDGEVYFRQPIAAGARWCMRWNHSVAGFAVSDCYHYDGVRMMLEKSHQPDFAAGLGHIAGRGVQRVAEGGGYWIEGIDEAVPGNCYRLRVGSLRVDHRLVMAGSETSLSRQAAGRSVRVSARRAGDAESASC